jgi:hypothetical protein
VPGHCVDQLHFLESGLYFRRYANLNELVVGSLSAQSIQYEVSPISPLQVILLQKENIARPKESVCANYSFP